MIKSVKYFEATLSNLILSMEAKSGRDNDFNLSSLMASVLYPEVD